MLHAPFICLWRTQFSCNSGDCVDRPLSVLLPIVLTKRFAEIIKLSSALPYGSAQNIYGKLILSYIQPLCTQTATWCMMSLRLLFLCCPLHLLPQLHLLPHLKLLPLHPLPSRLHLQKGRLCLPRQAIFPRSTLLIQPQMTSRLNFMWLKSTFTSHFILLDLKSP